MKFRQIHVYGFGKLVDTTIDLHPGMQVLYASNERGKSTLLAFIRAIFYGLGDKKNRDISNSRERYRPWIGGTWGGYIIFEHREKLMRLERIFGERKSDDKIRLFNENTGEEILRITKSQKQVGEVLLGFTPDEFNATTYIGQAPAERYFQDRDNAVYYRLLAILGKPTREFDTQTIKNNIREAIKQATRGKNTRSLEVLQNEAEANAAVLQRENACRADLAASEAKYRAVIDAVETKQQKLLASQKKCEKYLELQTLTQKKSTLQRDLSECTELRVTWENRCLDLAKNGIDGANHQLYKTELPKLLKKVQEQAWSLKKAAQRLSDLRNKLNIAETQLAARAIKPNKAGKWPWDEYTEQQNEYQKLAASAAKTSELLDLKTRQVELRRRSLTKAEEIKSTQADLQRIYDQIETTKSELLQYQALAANAAHQVEVAEKKYVAEEARLDEKQRIRTHDQKLRLQRYNFRLKLLSSAGFAFSAIAVILTLLTTLLFQNAVAKQAGYVTAIMTLIIGLGLLIHRSIFPPAEPKPISDPDSISGLNYLKAEAEDLRGKQIKLQQEIKVRSADITTKINMAGEKKAVLSALKAEKNSAEELGEDLAVQIATAESNYKLSPSINSLSEKIDALRRQMQEIDVWGKNFCDFFHIKDADVKAWQIDFMQQKQAVEIMRTDVATADADYNDVAESATGLLVQVREKYPQFIMAEPGPFLKPDTKPDANPDVNSDTKPDTNPDAESDSKTDPNPDANLDANPDTVAANEAVSRLLKSDPSAVDTVFYSSVPSATIQYSLEKVIRYLTDLLNRLQGYEQLAEQVMKRLTDIVTANNLSASLNGTVLAKVDLVNFLPNISKIRENLADRISEIDAVQTKTLEEISDHDSAKADFELGLLKSDDTHQSEYLNKNIEMEQIAQDSLRQEIKEMQQEAEGRLIEFRNYQSELAEMEELKRQQKDLAMEIELKEQSIARLNKAAAWFDQAVEHFENEFSPKLSEAAGKYLRDLTANRYDQVHIARNFATKIDVDDSLIMKPSEVFSNGTYDQIFLAQRLAVIDFLDTNRELPILADDPFVNYDQERMCAAYKLLAKIAHTDDRQILMVTCHAAPNGFIPKNEGCTWQVWQ